MNVKSIEKGKSNSAMMLDRIGVYIYIYIYIYINRQNKI